MAGTSRAASTSRPAGRRQDADSAFEASAFERGAARGAGLRWIGWRRRTLALLALLGCLGTFALARWLVTTPELDARWAAGPDGELRLLGSPDPALSGLQGHALVAIGAPGQAESPASALLLGRLPRWQVDDATREAQIAQQQGLARALASAGVGGTLALRFDDGSVVGAAVAPLGLAGLGVLFWPLVGTALLLYLFASVLLLARPQPGTLLFAVMSLCQSANLLFVAVEASGALSRFAIPLAGHIGLRTTLDLCTAAAIVHAFALHPRPLPRRGRIAAAAWGAVPAWWALYALSQAGLAGHLWWWAQGACVGLGAAALVVVGHSQRAHAHPYALAMRRFAAAGLAALVLTTAVVALASLTPRAAELTLGAVVSFRLFLAGLLLLTPFLSRSRQLLREFALVAGVSCVATGLDLLFAAFFSLGPFTSLAVAVFIALGLYAGARQWLINRMLGSRLLTTERAFELIYRAAREVRVRPSSHPRLLGELLRSLFEPLALERADRAPQQARVLGGGATLVVPIRGVEDAASTEAAAALLLRFAARGKRLFTPEDAQLADRVVDQLRRALAYDQAFERGRVEERQRIAQDLHDDIGARLLTLMYQAPTPEMEDYIRHTLQDLKTLTRGLAAGEQRLSHAAAEWKADLTQRLTAASVTLGWSFSHDRDPQLTMVQWSALTRVIRELVSNALYHGHAERVDLHFSLIGSALLLRIADDGDGRRPQDWSHGLGLGGVRKRVKLLGGEVAWRENHPRGIVCELRVAAFDAATRPDDVP